MDWANESFAIAEQAQTKYCARLGASCDQPAGKVAIDAAYVVANVPIRREQLQKAGVRLARMLDTALGKQLLAHAPPTHKNGAASGGKVHAHRQKPWHSRAQHRQQGRRPPTRTGCRPSLWYL